MVAVRELNLPEEEQKQLAALILTLKNEDTTNAPYIGRGEVTQKDDRSIVLEINNNEAVVSKIVFVSDATQVVKSMVATVGEVEVGSSVTVIGKENNNGTITARAIQVLPHESN